MIAALAIAGALAGFMVFNFPPASVFMGDEGALAVGLVLGVLSIQGSHFGEGSLPARFAMPLLALMVPLLDTVTVTVTRLATGNPVSRRGLDHSHHRLTRLGLSSWRAAAALIGLQVIAGGCAIALSLVPGYDAVLLIPYMALFFALVALFMMDRSFDAEAPGQIEDLPALARHSELRLQAPLRRVVPRCGAGGGGGVFWRDAPAIRLRPEHRAGGPDDCGPAV